MMGTASLEFVGFGLAIAILSNLHGSVFWRQLVLLCASVGFLAFFSFNPLFFIPLAGFLAFGFAGVTLLQRGFKRSFIPLVIVGIAAFVWLKKYAFVPSSLLIDHPYVTLGLSYIFFRVLHLIIDAHSDDLPGKVGAVSYLNYTLNFTTLVSGPIQTYPDFAKSQLAATPLPLNLPIVARSLERIVAGFYKVNVLSLFLSMAQKSSLASLLDGTSHDRVVAGAVVVAVYPLYLYCNFSGYIDIVIGLARLLRIELPENFDRPFSSPSFLIFWNRWHITLSNWLKTYVYNPLLISCMNRWSSPKAEPVIVVFAFFFTFFLIGVWHGQTSEFLFYGILLGLGVSVNKLYQIVLLRRLKRARYNTLTRNPLYVSVARGITFTWFTFSLLWFWSNWTQLHAMTATMTTGEIAGAWGLVWIAATALLAGWEAFRGWLYSFKFEGLPLMESRYVRTVWFTAFVVITAVVLSLLNAPAPDIVYKAF